VSWTLIQKPQEYGGPGPSWSVAPEKKKNKMMMMMMMMMIMMTV
jgi:hypothetical protein